MDVFSLLSLPESMIVLGAGAIGVEIGQAFGRLGCRVTLVEMASEILPVEDADIAAVVSERIQKEGVRVLTGARALSVEASGGKKRVTVQVAGAEQTLEAEALFVATGRKANVEALGLEKAGVKFSARGIPTDSRLRTNIAHIYACGDVNGRLPFTHVAGYEGGIVFTNAILRLPVRADYESIPWCTYTEPEVASLGLNEKRAIAKGLQYKVHKEKFRDIDRALAEGEEEGVLKLLLAKNNKVLGVQIVGPHAGELLHEWTALLAAKGGLGQLAMSVHAYPTLAEINKKAAFNVIYGKKLSAGVKVLLGFLRQLP